MARIFLLLPGESDPNVGFEYLLDSLTRGPHSLVVQATDANGNIAIFPTIHVSVASGHVSETLVRFP